MGTLTNKRVLLGITGGIAAYKSAELARRLREHGAEVRVAMTAAAQTFITPLTMQALSGNPVHTQLLDPASEMGMGHIELARWADTVLIAPASANFLAKLAQGRADDLLTTICVATQAPIAVAPAMNRQMWDNAATQNNIEAIKARGVKIFGPASGSQACGEIGLGRLLEPVELINACAALFETGLLAGLSIVITAGPTWEALDPVRGLTNRSSGKMGYAIAAAAAEAAGRVTLITGPTALPDPERVQTVHVTSAEEMHAAVQAYIKDAQIFVGAAAVADYRPAQFLQDKIKTQGERLVIELIKNPDILASVAARTAPPYTVGFAAETRDLIAHARIKLDSKGVDLIAANIVGIPGSGFEADENRLTLVDRAGVSELPLLHKSHLARLFIQQIAQRYYAKNSAQNSRPSHR